LLSTVLDRGLTDSKKKSAIFRKPDIIAPLSLKIASSVDHIELAVFILTRKGLRMETKKARISVVAIDDGYKVTIDDTSGQWREVGGAPLPYEQAVRVAKTHAERCPATFEYVPLRKK